MTGLGLHSLRLLTRMTSLSTCPFPRFPCIPSLTKDMCRDLLMSRPMVGCAQPRSIPIPQQRRRTRLFGLQHIRSMHNNLDFRHINFNVSAGLYVIYLRSQAFTLDTFAFDTHKYYNGIDQILCILEVRRVSLGLICTYFTLNTMMLICQWQNLRLGKAHPAVPSYFGWRFP